MYQKNKLQFIIETIFFLAILVLFTNCKGEEEKGDDPRVTPETTFIGQNIIEIDGPTIGSGASANNTLYKKVGVALSSQHVDLKITKVYIQKAETLESFRVDYVIPIQNVSENHAYCGVRSTGLTFLNSEYSKIYSDVLNSKAYSSIGLSNSTDWDHCIKPLGTGYIVGSAEFISLDPYNKIKFVELGISISSDSVINSGAKLEASSYSVNNGWIEVSIKNNGFDTAYVWPYTSIVLILDSDGSPMQWRYLNPNLTLPIQIDSTVGSTEPLPVLNSQATFSGSSSKALFLLTFSTNQFYPF